VLAAVTAEGKSSGQAAVDNLNEILAMDQAQ
jgi:hypothetical protein